MKVYKSNQLSLLPKIVGLGGHLYLTVTVLVFFDLDRPEEPLNEQELWKTVPEQLGPGQVLDLGLPKPRGEILVTGSCFAPRGTTRMAAQVSARVGPVSKTLNVFGPRYWKSIGAVLGRFTAPEPFSEVPLTWNLAFGGSDYPANPVGRGHIPVGSPPPPQAPLPQIEDPRHLVGAPTDNPPPAGFGPLDLMWPQRAGKRGTYDQAWLRERWPHFPADLNPEFFNVAPEDQYLEGYFRGDETIELENMHPDLPVITSYLPGLRIRCFVTQKQTGPTTNGEPAGGPKEFFEEVKTRLDTVWLLPTVRRSVLMYRGITEVHDEEYDDIVSIYVAAEKMIDRPQTPEYHLDAQQRARPQKPEIDPAPFQKAQKKIADALKRIKQIPKDVEAARLKALGQTPTMPRTPAEMKAQAGVLAGRSMALVDGMEAMARKNQARYGHLVAIDLNLFDRVRAKIQKAQAKIDKGVAKLEAAQEKALVHKEAIPKTVAAKLKARIPPDLLAKAGINPDDLSRKGMPRPWADRGFSLVIEWRRNLEQNSDARDKLHALGLTNRTIRRAWLGLNPTRIEEDPAIWGLKPVLDETGRPGPLIIPAGLVLPRFAGPYLNRLLVRPGEFTSASDEILVPGSAEVPLFLAAVEPESPLVIVPNELAARFLEQEIGDAVGVLAMSGPGEKPDPAAAQALAEAPAILVVLGPTPPSPVAWEPWAQAWPQARPILLPEGRDIFEAARKGHDPRRWIMAALPPDFAARHQVEIDLPEPGQPPSGSPLAGLALPNFDIKAMVAQLMTDIRAAYAPKFARIEAQRAATLERAKKTLRQAGQDPEAVLGAFKNRPKPSLTEIGENIARKVAAQRDRLKARGALSPEVEARMNAIMAKAAKMTQEGQARLEDGLARIAAAKEKARNSAAEARAGRPPDLALAKLKAAGLDPDRIRRRSKEEVIDFHRRGLSLAGAIISGLDLSGLDLTGVDLSQAQCRKTKFTGAQLSRAKLGGALAAEADFSYADLSQATLEKGLFMKAVFRKADISQANLHQAILKAADLTGANLSGARLDWTILQRANLAGARMAGIKAEMGVFTGADLTAVDLTEAQLTKCLIKDVKLDRADFSRARLDSTMLMAVTGERVKFIQADLRKVRMAAGSVLVGADFREADLTEACCRETDLSEARFEGAVLDSVLLEKCRMHRVGLVGVHARAARLTKCDLEEADLRGIDLFMGSLRKSRLTRADLRASNLFGVDFYKVVLGETRFDRANTTRSLLYQRIELAQ